MKYKEGDVIKIKNYISPELRNLMPYFSPSDINMEHLLGEVFTVKKVNITSYGRTTYLIRDNDGSSWYVIGDWIEHKIDLSVSLYDI